MRGPDPDLALRGSQPAGFRIVAQNVEERVLGRRKVLGALDVGKVLHAAHTSAEPKMFCFFLNAH